MRRGIVVPRTVIRGDDFVKCRVPIPVSDFYVDSRVKKEFDDVQWRISAMFTSMFKIWIYFPKDVGIVPEVFLDIYYSAFVKKVDPLHFGN